jgi:hypothetical protein
VFTIEALFKPSGQSGGGWIVCKPAYNGVHNNPFADWGMLYNWPTAGSVGYSMAVDGGVIYDDSGGGTFPDNGSWYHVVWVFNTDDNTSAWYRNGVLIRNATGITSGTVLNTSSADVRLGAMGSGAENYNGSLAFVAIYDRCLTKREAMDRYINPWAPFISTLSAYRGQVAGVAQAYFSTLDGTLSTVGALNRLASTFKIGALAPAGNLLKQTATAKASLLTITGLLVKQAGKSLTGTLTTAGVLTSIKTILMDLGIATLSMAGGLVKQAGKPLTGTLSTAGSVMKQAGKSLTGTLTTAGVLTVTRIVMKMITSTLTTAGSLTKQTGKTLVGTLSTAGALIKEIRKFFIGVLSADGALAAVFLAPIDLVRTVLVRLHIVRAVQRDLSVQVSCEKEAHVQSKIDRIGEL